MGPHHMMPRDTDAVRDVHLQDGTAKRVWAFARPYRSTIILFLVAILVAALLALVPPLVVREILDNAIPQGDRRLIVWLATAAVVSALADAALQILQRWCSARVGEGLIADLRIALYAKVQRLPVGFFTRTPTGAITSRLSNDVVGAQSALTSTLGSVVSNVIVLVTTLATMAALALAGAAAAGGSLFAPPALEEVLDRCFRCARQWGHAAAALRGCCSAPSCRENPNSQRES